MNDPYVDRMDREAREDEAYGRHVEQERRDRELEKGYAGRATNGDVVGQDAPTLTDTMSQLDAVKGEHTHLVGERADVNAAVENAQWMSETFRDLGFDYDEVHAAGLGLGLQYSDTLIDVVNRAGEMSQAEFRRKLMALIGDTWVDGLLVGATHRKAVE